MDFSILRIEMASRQTVAALLAIALAIIHIVGGTSVLRDAIDKEYDETETQEQSTTIDLEEFQELSEEEQETNEDTEYSKSLGGKKFVIVIANATNATTAAPKTKPFLGIFDKKFVIVIANATNATTTAPKKKPFLGIFDKKFIIVIANATNVTTAAPTVIYKKKPFLGIFDTDTKDRIRAQFIAHRLALEQIIADSGLDNKVKIIYQTRNLDTGEEDGIEDLIDIEHDIEDEEDDDDENILETDNIN